MNRLPFWPTLFIGCLVAAALTPPGSHGTAATSSIPETLYSGLKWRLIGPGRGGRVAAVTGVPSQPDTYYVGAALGGVWKTTDGGHAWMPLFDHQRVGSIGAIAVARSNPDIVYVGTGESAPREDVSIGDGVYKSIDGGRTWTHVGLGDSQHISRIVIDPANPDRVLVAALGHVYGPNSERGVFRSTDGGASWQKVLYKDDRTGAIELAVDPDDPSTVFAALWEIQRTPWSLTSGGPGSGLYKSTDGGASWTASTQGLPEDVLGKIGVTVAAGTGGRRVYALVESGQGGLYRSDDGGATWQLANSEHQLWSRAWYFTKIWTHPQSPDTLFIAGGSFWKSTDGGKKFDRVAIPGGDNHDLWINPQNPGRMIEGNDQGVVLTVNGGATWDKRNNLPIGQFYHVSSDRAFPPLIYGAQQDMGAIAIATRGWGGIGDRDWFNVGGDDGECGYVWPVPLDSRRVVAGGYNGALTLFDTRTHQLRDIAPWSNASGGHPASDLKYRFTWTSPVVFSPLDPHVLLHGIPIPDGNAEPRCELEGHQPRSHAQRQEQAGGLRWTDHQGQRVGGVLRRHLLDRAVAGAGRPHLDRHRRRPRPDHQRRRRDVAEGDASGPPRVGQDLADRGVPLRRRDGVRRRGRAQTRRPQAVHLPHPRQRTHVDAHHRRSRRARRTCTPCARIQNGKDCCSRGPKRESTCRSTTGTDGSRCS